MISECANYPDSYRYEDEGDPRLEELTINQAIKWEGYLRYEFDPMPLKQFLEMMEEEESEGRNHN